MDTYLNPDDPTREAFASAPWKHVFLATYARTGSVQVAAQHAGVTRQAVHYHRKRDPIFAEAYNLAREEIHESLIMEAHRRAVIGVTEPVFYRGVKIGEKQKFSDRLLLFLLENTRPDAETN